MIHIEENWTNLKSELLKTKREGIEKFVDFLEQKTDFKTAPASTKFHLCEEGGLVEHSLNVLKFGRLINEQLNVSDAHDSVALVCLLHDLCKVNYYIKGWEWDKEIKEKENRWQKKDCWKVEDQIPLGHGEKSVILAVRFIPLTVAEMTAIRWHMTGFDAGIHFSYPSGIPFRESMNKYPLLKLVILADEMAELHESLHYGPPGQIGLLDSKTA